MRAQWIVAAIAAVFVASGCTASTPPAPGSPTKAELEKLLSSVSVVNKRPNPPGYERDCEPGKGCVFGPAWTDDQDAPGGHNGCGTRNDVLRKQLTGVQFQNGSTCVVTGGTLADYYTGRTVEFTKAKASAIQIDHIYPLATAWDMGANTWPKEQRVRFANDIDFELLAVDGPTNQSKSDKSPSEWLPPHPTYHCFYAGKYLAVAAHYKLPITKPDESTLREIANTCGG